MKLTKKELKEPLYATWGRIRARVMYYSNDKRLIDLVEKLNKDLQKANVEEGYFK